MCTYVISNCNLGRYIISFLLDSTLGLVIIWAGIRLSIYIGQKQGWPTIIFGEYGKLIHHFFYGAFFATASQGKCLLNRIFVIWAAIGLI